MKNDFFKKLKERYEFFMEGRNGPDKISNFLFIVYLLIGVLKYFSPIAVYVAILQYILLAYILFRVLSHKKEKRYSETVKFDHTVKGWEFYIDRLKLRAENFPDYSFRTCRHCGEFLKIKRKFGIVKVTCTLCGKVNSYFLL